jgi:hypothetical protein
MNWYIVKMVFRIRCGNGNHRTQYDEQLRLIQSGNADQAIQKAFNLAESEASRGLTGMEPDVKWQFVNVSELYLLNSFIDGAEVFSRIQEQENAEQYERIIKRKADMIRFNIQQGLLELI